MDTDEPLPTLSSETFDRLQSALTSKGSAAAAEILCQELSDAQDYQGLFYAMLLKARVGMGVNPFPTAPASELPTETHETYENAIREAGRHVGKLYIAKGDLAHAWGFYRMLGETDLMKEALESYQPGPDDDTYAAVDIAWHQGVHPKKGFDLVLDRQGICSAITMVGSSNLASVPELRDYCVKRLIRSLYEQLVERMRNDLNTRGNKTSEESSVAEMVKNHPAIFTEDMYHIDVSHLNSVVQFAMQLTSPCEELDLSLELCQYGEKLSPHLSGDSPAPFERGYADYYVYLSILAGHDVDKGLNHFQSKLDQAQSEGETFPAETVVNLLLRLNRTTEALAVAKKYLSEPHGELSCPSVLELARRVQDYSTIAEHSRNSADAVNYLAALIQLVK